eukprot:CAMPEP_0197317082 /NCGR_PEP_ID=MMETSP0891-20130614/45584_1 /TAXON_ID=44058 ORGANISM="Aureoumbra lagunensis, Strain CCMP1510" /NCGR_SAMPLE_ID=MMETSP0891 /ASSEMBLY_ACC=CAM_ASM_000534 /LENGTH=1183 /DNA_ID=CAMNT_0042806885 /DNA_START=266 /DNA_END=3817 /DNA_ORIENTATION=-
MSTALRADAAMTLGPECFFLEEAPFQFASPEVLANLLEYKAQSIALVRAALSHDDNQIIARFLSEAPPRSAFVPDYATSVDGWTETLLDTVTAEPIAIRNLLKISDKLPNGLALRLFYRITKNNRLDLLENCASLTINDTYDELFEDDDALVDAACSAESLFHSYENDDEFDSLVLDTQKCERASLAMRLLRQRLTENSDENNFVLTGKAAACCLGASSRSTLRRRSSIFGMLDACTYELGGGHFHAYPKCDDLPHPREQLRALLIKVQSQKSGLGRKGPNFASRFISRENTVYAQKEIPFPQDFRKHLRYALRLALDAARLGDVLLAKTCVPSSEAPREANAMVWCVLRLVSELTLAFPPSALQLTPISCSARSVEFAALKMLRHLPRCIILDVANDALRNAPGVRYGSLRLLCAILPPRAPRRCFAYAQVDTSFRDDITWADADDDCIFASSPKANKIAIRALGTAALRAYFDGSTSSFTRMIECGNEYFDRDNELWRQDLDEKSELIGAIVGSLASASASIQSAAAELFCRCVELKGAVAISFFVSAIRDAINEAREIQLAEKNSKEDLSKIKRYTAPPGATVARLLLGARWLASTRHGRRCLLGSGLHFMLIECLTIARPDALCLDLETHALILDDTELFFENCGEQEDEQSKKERAAYVEALVRALVRVLAKYHKADFQVHFCAARCLALIARNKEHAFRVLIQLETRKIMRRVLPALAVYFTSQLTSTSQLALRAAAWIVHVPAALAWDAGLDPGRIANLLVGDDDEKEHASANLLETLSKFESESKYLEFAKRAARDLVDLREQHGADPLNENDLHDNISRLQDTELNFRLKKLATAKLKSEPIQANPRVLVLNDDDEPPRSEPNAASWPEISLSAFGSLVNDDMAFIGAEQRKKQWDPALTLAAVAIRDAPLSAVRYALAQLKNSIESVQEAVNRETRELDAARRLRLLGDDDDDDDVLIPPPLPKNDVEINDEIQRGGNNEMDAPADPRRRRTAPPQPPPPIPHPPHPGMHSMPTPHDPYGPTEIPFAKRRRRFDEPVYPPEPPYMQPRPPHYDHHVPPPHHREPPLIPPPLDPRYQRQNQPPPRPPPPRSSKPGELGFKLPGKPDLTTRNSPSDSPRGDRGRGGVLPQVDPPPHSRAGNLGFSLPSQQQHQQQEGGSDTSSQQPPDPRRRRRR